MNKEEILAMEIGTELNAIVAVKVMGWKMVEGVQSGRLFWYDGNEKSHGVVYDFKPATDISAAWEVIEKLKHKLQIFTYMHNEDDFQDGWLVKIGGNCVEGISTAPEAICKAALICCMEGN